MNLEQLFQNFRKSRKYLQSVTDDTLRFYDVSWRAVDRHWKIEDTDELSKEVLEEMIISMRKAGIQPVSINTYISFLNAFLRWLFEEGFVTTHHRLKKLKVELKAVKIFKDDEVQRIITYKPQDFYEWRLWATMCLMFDTGIRSTECTGMNVKDVNLDQLYIKVKGKGQKERLVPISQEMRRILFQYTKKFKITDGLLFPTSNQTSVSRRNIIRDIANFCKKIGIHEAKLSPHTTWKVTRTDPSKDVIRRASAPPEPVRKCALEQTILDGDDFTPPACLMIS